CMYALEFPWTF
nr:immunoglobulin light chain junction region [Macaca mulatta]